MAESSVKLEIKCEPDDYGDFKPSSRKNDILQTWSREKKLAKLSVYSCCRFLNCTCNGWKSPKNYPIGSKNRDILEVYMEELCKTCSHPLGVLY